MNERETSGSISAVPVPRLTPEAQAALDGACKNTDRELWRERPGDFYSPSIHVTPEGGIGIDVGGHVFVLDVYGWHKLATDSYRTDMRKHGDDRL